jgi:hypothetical protein
MTWYDLGALVVVALAVLDGARSGLAWASAELAAILGVALAARALHAQIEPYLLKVADVAPDDRAGATHAIVFSALGALVIGVMILLHPASRRWRFRHDGWYGGALGALNGLLAALLVFSILLWSAPRPAVEETLAESRLSSALRVAEEARLGPLFPDRLPRRLVQLERP